MLVKVGQGNITNTDLNAILHNFPLTPLSEVQQSMGDV